MIPASTAAGGRYTLNTRPIAGVRPKPPPKNRPSYADLAQDPTPLRTDSLSATTDAATDAELRTSPIVFGSHSDEAIALDAGQIQNSIDQKKENEIEKPENGANENENEIGNDNGFENENVNEIENENENENEKAESGEKGIENIKNETNLDATPTEESAPDTSNEGASQIKSDALPIEPTATVITNNGKTTKQFNAWRDVRPASQCSSLRERSRTCTHQRSTSLVRSPSKEQTQALISPQRRPASQKNDKKRRPVTPPYDPSLIQPQQPSEPSQPQTQLPPPSNEQPPKKTPSQSTSQPSSQPSSQPPSAPSSQAPPSRRTPMLVRRVLSVAHLTHTSAACRQSNQPKPQPLMDDDMDLNKEPVFEMVPSSDALRTPTRDFMNPFFAPSNLLTRFYSVESSNPISAASSRSQIPSSREPKDIIKDAWLPSTVVVCMGTRGSTAGSKFQILIKIALKSVVSGRYVCADPVGMPVW